MHLKDFIKNSSIIFVSTVIGGVFSFAFHPLVARFLSVRDFAELQALLSLSVILGVPSATITIIVSRYVSKSYAHRDFAQIIYLKNCFVKKIAFCAGILLLLLSLSSPFIARYLRMDSVYPVMLTILIMFFSVFESVFSPILQGIQKFFAIASLGVVGAFLKLICGVFFALIFMNVYGALGGLLIQTILSILITAYVVKFYLKNGSDSNSGQFPIIKDYSYYYHSFFIILFLTIFFNIDVLLAKNIFNAETSGIYSATAVMAKAIIFATAALESVMFPVVVEKYEKNNNSLSFFLKSLSILILGLIFSVFIFYMFGEHFIALMGKEYSIGGQYLWRIAIFISLFALTNYLVKFLLAVKETLVVYFLGFGVILQIAFGYTFSKNISDFIDGMSYAMLGVLSTLIFYLIKKRRSLTPL